MNHQAARRLLSRMSYHNQASNIAMSHITSTVAPSFASPAAAFVPIGWQRNRIQHKHQHQSITTRLFGCNPNSPNAQPGDILLDDDRLNTDDDTTCNSGNNPTNILPINLTALHQTITHVRQIIGYPTYDISVSLISDAQMREINNLSRGIDAPTDVLSFCFQDEDDMVEPGVLGEVQFDTPDFYNLGDVLIDVDYVIRRCEADRKMHEEMSEDEEKRKEIGGLMEGEVITEEVELGTDNAAGTTADFTTIQQQQQQQQQSDNKEANPDNIKEDDEYEYIEIEVEEYDDRGVAPQMQYIYDPEIRIHMLLVHGMLHLVGYDHIEDDDYELMVVKEDEVLAELRRRLGDDFGVTNKALPE